ncbi:MAG: DUF6152 family protein [Acidobacteria bacterium]|nr:DUF6152 family protein [Acidobacteriota bacterium]
MHMTRRRLARVAIPAMLAAAGLLFVTAAAPVLAHHAFGAEFDPNRPVLLRGPVVKVEWVNPHAWIHMEVTGDDGTQEVWMVEGGTPNTLLRRGLRRDSIVPGMMIIVDGYQSKDRTARANGRDVTFEDGSKFFMGSSGTGAPRDGRDPTEPPR